MEQFKRFCSNRFIEKTLIPPTTMGRVCVQRVALYVHARAARAIKREAGGVRLRDAMRTACARGAQAPTTVFYRLYGYLLPVGPINGLRTGNPPTGRE